MKNQPKLSRLLQIGLVMTFLIPAAAEGQIRNDLKYTDVENSNLRGKVSELTNNEYDVEYTDSICYDIKPNNSYLDGCNYRIIFNNKGFKTKKYVYSIEDHDSLINRQEWDYHYDNLNRKIKEKRVSYIFQTDSIIWTYAYLKDTAKVRQMGKYDNYNFVYIQNNEKEILIQDQNTPFAKKRIYIYDPQNRIIRKEYYNTDGRASSIYFYYYENNLSAAKSREVDVWCEMNSITNTNFTNDSFGNPVEVKKNFASKNVSDISKNEFEYDKEGNWIEKRSFNAKGLLNSIIKREIKYYK
jgi:hypothetical protein